MPKPRGPRRSSSQLGPSALPIEEEDLIQLAAHSKLPWARRRWASRAFCQMKPSSLAGRLASNRVVPRLLFV
eukprot:7645879-Pyramimonas_sp.AAC.1